MTLKTTGAGEGLKGYTTKLAAIREPGSPVGQPAPCFFHCACGKKVPAFQPGIQTCECGTQYSRDGWVI